MHPDGVSEHVFEDLVRAARTHEHETVRGLDEADTSALRDLDAALEARDAFSTLDALAALADTGLGAGALAWVVRSSGIEVVETEQFGSLFRLGASILRVSRAGDGEPRATVGLSSELVLAEAGINPYTLEQTTPSSDEAANYRLTDADAEWLHSSSKREKVHANLDALELLTRLERESRAATSAEQSVLARYTGFGQMPELFARWSDDYRKERERLEVLLPPGSEPYSLARTSTQNAHYTSCEVVDAIYFGLDRLGFKGGRILEPSVGVGNFFGRMPESIRQHPSTVVTGVDMDPTSVKIARHLYPRHPHIVASPFESSELLDGFYDCAIGNVPFGDYQIHDRGLNAKYGISGKGLRVHNYFFAAALEKVRENGLVAFITSTGTLDAADVEPFRRRLAWEAELLGAVRLPAGAFRRTSGTDVTTDLIILRKRTQAERLAAVSDNAEEPPGPRWWGPVPTNVRATAGYPEILNINEYFAANPEMVCGDLAAGGQYGNRLVVAARDGDLAATLRKALERLPEQCYRERENSQPAAGRREFTGRFHDRGVKNFGYVVEQVHGADRLFVREGRELIETAASPDRIARVAGLLAIRDRVEAVLHSQVSGFDRDLQDAARQSLNAAYDDFVSRFGPISSKENVSAFRGDPDSFLLLALENFDQDGNRAEKTTIFFETVVARPDLVERVETAGDAVALSVLESGHVDIETVARRLGVSRVEAAAALTAERAAFCDPVTLAWVAADAYLSGDVRTKLATARAAARADPKFTPNVDALTAAQPDWVPARDIGIRLGVGWIPPDVVDQFVLDVLGVSVKSDYLEPTAEWIVMERGWRGRDGVQNITVWGTPSVPGVDLVQLALNSKLPNVYVPESKPRLLDVGATEAAREKQMKLRERFKEWVWEDDERLVRLEKIYNTRLNRHRPRSFSEAHYVIPGMNPLWTGDGSKNETGLRAHQFAAVRRIAAGENTYLAHAVGAGKTMCLIAGTMECVRLGISKKPMFVIPNQTIAQFVMEFQRLYPAAKILAASDGDLLAGNRQEFLARVATGRWDAVIVPHSSFKLLPVAVETRRAFYLERMSVLDEALSSSTGSRRDHSVVKKIEAAKRRYQSKLAELASMRKDDTTTFEQLGVDRLIVDEAHAYKALEYHTKMTNVAGLSSTKGSEIAFDMFMKTRYIESICGEGRGVVFASGTPVTNTLAELFTVMRFMQYRVLCERGLLHFDAWASVFGETVTGFEATPTGRYQLKSRFAEFVNLPELMSLFRSFADIRTADMLDLPRPELITGKPIPVICEISDDQIRYVETLERRVDRIKAKLVDPDKDNMLVISTHGRASMVDIRLREPWRDRDPGCKVAKLAQTVAEVRRKHPGTTQIVFCDHGTPSKKTKRRHSRSALHESSFNLYADIRAALIEQGYSSSEVAFIHDADTNAKKLRMFADFDAGRIKVLVGSTEKLGTGVNVQRKVIAVHHLDVPWRPCDLEQRTGRALRQGNENQHTGIYDFRYVTRGRNGRPSFDTYLWQLNEAKARFIGQVMTGGEVPRRAEDVQERALTFAEFKAIASGNPLLLEKVTVDKELQRLDRLHTSFLDERRRLRADLNDWLPSSLRWSKARLARLEADLTVVESNPSQGDNFRMQVGKTVYRDREEAGAALASAFKRTVVVDGMVVDVGSFRGLRLTVSAWLDATRLDIRGLTVAGSENQYAINVGDTGRATTASAEALLRTLPQQIASERAKIAEYEKKLEDVASLLEHPFEHADRRDELRLRQTAINRELEITSNDVQSSMKSDEGGEQAPSASASTHFAEPGTVVEALEEAERQDFQSGALQLLVAARTRSNRDNIPLEEAATGLLVAATRSGPDGAWHDHVVGFARTFLSGCAERLADAVEQDDESLPPWVEDLVAAAMLPDPSLPTLAALEEIERGGFEPAAHRLLCVARARVELAGAPLDEAIAHVLEEAANAQPGSDYTAGDIRLALACLDARKTGVVAAPTPVPGRLVVVAGPSGVGKTTLVEALVSRLPGLARAVTTTTRPPRPGETDGVNYHFVDPATFDRLVEDDAFLEHAEVLGNRYGTTRTAVTRVLDSGNAAIVILDVQGAAAIRTSTPEARTVFLAPPSLDELQRRLRSREEASGAADPRNIEQRLAAAREELSRTAEFDCVLVNGDFETALASLASFVVSGRATGNSEDVAKDASDGLSATAPELPFLAPPLVVDLADDLPTATPTPVVAAPVAVEHTDDPAAVAPELPLAEPAAVEHTDDPPPATPHVPIVAAPYGDVRSQKASTPSALNWLESMGLANVGATVLLARAEVISEAWDVDRRLAAAVMVAAAARVDLEGDPTIERALVAGIPDASIAVARQYSAVVAAALDDGRPTPIEVLLAFREPLGNLGIPHPVPSWRDLGWGRGLASSRPAVDVSGYVEMNPDTSTPPVSEQALDAHRAQAGPVSSLQSGEVTTPVGSPSQEVAAGISPAAFGLPDLWRGVVPDDDAVVALSAPAGVLTLRITGYEQEIPGEYLWEAAVSVRGREVGGPERPFRHPDNAIAAATTMARNLLSEVDVFTPDEIGEAVDALSALEADLARNIAADSEPELSKPLYTCTFEEIVGERPRVDASARRWDENRFRAEPCSPGPVSEPVHRTAPQTALLGDGRGLLDVVYEFAVAEDRIFDKERALLMSRLTDPAGIPIPGFDQWKPVGEYFDGVVGVLASHRGKGAGVAFVKALARAGVHPPAGGGIYSPEGLRTIMRAHRELVAEAMEDGLDVPQRVRDSIRERGSVAAAPVAERFIHPETLLWCRVEARPGGVCRGYVEIPEDHPLATGAATIPDHLGDIPGGVTWTGPARSVSILSPHDVRLVGFDISDSPREAVHQDTISLARSRAFDLARRVAACRGVSGAVLPATPSAGISRSGAGLSVAEPDGPGPARRGTATMIVLDRAEGAVGECARETLTGAEGDPWSRARETLTRWAESVPEGSVNKVEFEVAFDNGTRTTGVYELAALSREQPCLARHIRDGFEFRAGRRGPGHMSAGQYADMLAAGGQDRVAQAARLLDSLVLPESPKSVVRYPEDPATGSPQWAVESTGTDYALRQRAEGLGGLFDDTGLPSVFAFRNRQNAGRFAAEIVVGAATVDDLLDPVAARAADVRDGSLIAAAAPEEAPERVEPSTGAPVTRSDMHALYASASNAHLAAALDILPVGSQLGNAVRIDRNGEALWIRNDGHAAASIAIVEQLGREQTIDALYDLRASEEPARLLSGRAGEDAEQRLRVWSAVKSHYDELKQHASGMPDRLKLISQGGQVEAWVSLCPADFIRTLDGREPAEIVRLVLDSRRRRTAVPEVVQTRMQL